MISWWFNAELWCVDKDALGVNMHPRENPYLKHLTKYCFNPSSYPCNWSFSLSAFTGVGSLSVIFRFVTCFTSDFWMLTPAVVTGMCKGAWYCFAFVSLIVGVAESDPTDSPGVLFPKVLHEWIICTIVQWRFPLTSYRIHHMLAKLHPFCSSLIKDIMPNKGGWDLFEAVCIWKPEMY